MRCKGGRKGRPQKDGGRKFGGETKGCFALETCGKSRSGHSAGQVVWKSEVGLRPVPYTWMFSTWSWCLRQQHGEKGGPGGAAQ